MQAQIVGWVSAPRQQVWHHGCRRRRHDTERSQAVLRHGVQLQGAEVVTGKRLARHEKPSAAPPAGGPWRQAAASARRRPHTARAVSHDLGHGLMRCGPPSSYTAPMLAADADCAASPPPRRPRTPVAKRAVARARQRGTGARAQQRRSGSRGRRRGRRSPKAGTGSGRWLARTRGLASPRVRRWCELPSPTRRALICSRASPGAGAGVQQAREVDVGAAEAPPSRPRSPGMPTRLMVASAAAQGVGREGRTAS